MEIVRTGFAITTGSRRRIICLRSTVMWKDASGICGFAKDGRNSDIIPKASLLLSDEEPERMDMLDFYTKLKEEILPIYCGKTGEWSRIVFQSMSDVVPFFETDRMAAEYYEVMYKDNS